MIARFKIYEKSDNEVTDMDLYQKILTDLLAYYCARKAKFADFIQEESEIVEMKCRRTIQKIKAIIENDSFDKHECVTKVEEIIWALEDIGLEGSLN